MTHAQKEDMRRKHLSLELTEEEMREMGYRVIDTIINHMTGIRTKPVINRIDSADLEQAISLEVHRESADWDTVLSSVERHVMPHIGHLDHTRQFGFISSPNNFVSVMGDLLASGLNINAGFESLSSAPTAIERSIVDWFAQLCGLPESAGGTLVSGGSVANLTALAAAVHTRLGTDRADAVFYTTEQAHTAALNALTVLGIARDQVRVIATDDRYRMNVEELRQAIAEDTVASKQPFCVIATAGTTNTGAIDPLDEIANVCERERLWFHVDGAYGAMATLTPQGKQLLSGLERADSIVLDPHKWLFQPYDIGCILMKDASLLTQTFREKPVCLRDTCRVDEHNFGEYGIQLSRRFRALPIWMSLQTFGSDHVARAMEYGMALATCAQERLEQLDGWKIITRAQLAIVTFRYTQDGWTDEQTNTVNTAILERIQKANFMGTSSTELDGMVTLRMCTINPRTNVGDIEDVVVHMDAIAQEVIASMQSSHPGQ